MPHNKKCDLKIKMTVERKEQILRESEEYGFATMSKYVLACIDAAPVAAQVHASRNIMRTLQRLVELEGNAGSSLSKDERRALTTKVRERLLHLCSDDGGI